MFFFRKKKRRECGGCTLCCYTHRVDIPFENEPLTKEYEWCKFCEIGKGCSIYHRRPDGCWKFDCAWLQQEFGTDDERPDKMRIVPEWIRTEFGRTLALIGETAEALQTEIARRITTEYVDRGYAVIHAFPGDRYLLVLPAGTIVSDKILELATKEHLEIGFFEAAY